MGEMGWALVGHQRKFCHGFVVVNGSGRVGVCTLDRGLCVVMLKLFFFFFCM